MTESSKSTTDDDELLTAYLDGELDEQQVVAVEQRLTEEKSFHLRMQEMESAWEMLDQLPRPIPADSFMKTTLELAAMTPQAEVKISWWNRRRIWVAAMLTLPFLLFAANYMITRDALEQPRRQLINDLPLIENFDRYQKVISAGSPEDGIKFLERLNRSGTFADIEDMPPLVDIQPPAPIVAPADEAGPVSRETVEDRVASLMALTSEQRDMLFLKKEELDSLPHEQQRSLRDFSRRLSQHPRSKELAGTLVSWYEWLRTLGQGELAELLDMQVDQRLRQVNVILGRQAAEALSRVGPAELPAEDAEYFYGWYEIVVNVHRAALRTRALEIQQEKWKEQNVTVDDDMVQKFESMPIERVVGMLMKDDPDRLVEIICDVGNEADQSWLGIDGLRNILSPSSDRILASLTVDQQRALILEWIEDINDINKTRRIKRKNLERYYANLPSPTRDQLDNLHPDQWYQTLKQMYLDKLTSLPRDQPVDPPETDPTAWDKLFRDATGLMFQPDE